MDALGNSGAGQVKKFLVAFDRNNGASGRQGREQFF